MTAVVYAHKAGRGNGVGLHYSRSFWRFIVPPSQRLGLMPPAQNRHFPPRIREVGLVARKPLIRVKYRLRASRSLQFKLTVSFPLNRVFKRKQPAADIRSPKS